MSEVILIPVEEWAIHCLYHLLAEREPEVNISHKAMPSYEEHEAFVKSKPYEQWLMIVTVTPVTSHQDIKAVQQPVGTCYITHMGEIGIQIVAEHQRKGYARTALNTLIAMHPGRRLLANISPNNPASAALFRSFGFNLIQHTYSLETA